MDVATLATSFVAARAAQMQLAVASAMMRLEADQQASVANLLAAASENAQEMAGAVEGLGANLDIRV